MIRIKKTIKKAKKGRPKKEKVEKKKPKAKKEKPKKKKVRKIAKKVVKKPARPKKAKTRYFEAVGRRKTAVARVRLFTRGSVGASSNEEAPTLEEKDFLVNEKSYQDYFRISDLQQIITSPLRKMKCLDRFRVSIRVKGGGLHSQAEAIRHGIARALLLFNSDFRKRLKKAGYLTRDPRMRERKKFGLKRARRAPQWSKR